jgi:hypothetical protein
LSTPERKEVDLLFAMVSSSFARILCEFPFIWILQWELFILKPVRISCCRYDIFWFLLVSYPFAYFMIISYKYLFWTYLQYRKNYSDYLLVIELIRIKVELLSYQWNYLTDRLLFIFIEFWVRLWDFAILVRRIGNWAWNKKSFTLNPFTRWAVYSCWYILLSCSAQKEWGHSARPPALWMYS